MKIDNFIKIEKKYDLYHMEIDGVQPWMYYRFKFWNYQICRELLSLSGNVQSEGRIRSCGRQLKTAFILFMKGNARNVCKADMIFYTHPRRIRNNGYFECIYTERLQERYPHSIILEEPFQNRHLEPVKTEHIYYTDLLQIKSVLYSKIQSFLKTGRYRKVYRQVQEYFEAPIAEMRKAYACKLIPQQVYKELTQIVFEIQVLKGELRKVIGKIQPRMVVEVVGYNKRCMILNELAKEMGIPTIELQHGTMHAAHAAYQFAEECGQISQFPDYVFMFSEYWKKCAHLPIDDDKIRVTGYPYFESQIRRYRQADINKGNITNIIFISQGTIGRELSRLAAELSSLLDETKYHIIYKLHPGEYIGWKNRNAELLRDNIEVIDSAEHNIYEFFSVCKIQVGVYSTAIYEGLGFGLTTYIYDVGHADTMAGLCEQGYAVYVHSAEELYTHIIAGETDRRDCGNEFWKMNSLENICEEIDKLLESN